MWLNIWVLEYSATCSEVRIKSSLNAVGFLSWKLTLNENKFKCSTGQNLVHETGGKCS